MAVDTQDIAATREEAERFELEPLIVVDTSARAPRARVAGR